MPDTGKYQLQVSLVADASNPRCQKASTLLALKMVDQGTPKCWAPDSGIFLRIDAVEKVGPTDSPLRARRSRAPAKRKGASKKRR